MEVKTSFNRKKYRVKYRLNCLIVSEDNVFALDTKCQLEELGLKVLTIAKTLDEVGEALQTHSIDIILGDEKLNGTNYVNELYSGLDSKPPFILFSRKNSVDLIERGNITYPYVTLNKSFDDVSLRAAVATAFSDRISSLKQSGDIGKERDILYVRSSGKLISLKTNEIDYIKAEGNYCTIHVESKRIVIRSSISNALKMIDEPNFVQIHRGYIANVNLTNELAISKGNLQVGNEKLPIGRKYKNELMSLKNR